jgi:hypothetical protein
VPEIEAETEAEAMDSLGSSHTLGTLPALLSQLA